MTIEVKDLTHIYNKGLPHESIALDDVSFTVKDGEFVGIIGHTGSGKSTLLQHINGLLKPDSGSIVIDEIDLGDSRTRMLAIRKKVGLVFQYPEYQLFEETVEKDISFGPKNLGLDQVEINRRVRKTMELVGLDYYGMRNKSPFELSGGQKRRVAIAGVLAMSPKVLILDEPTAGLNPGAHEDVLNMVRHIHYSEDNITILVSHNMNDIARLCDRVLVMDGGRLVMNGKPEEVFSKKEELASMGLTQPDSMKIAGALRDAGIHIGGNCLNIDRTIAAIAAEIK